MKLKKFFAGVVAAAMMLTVGATAAFADGETTATNSMITAVNGVANFSMTKNLTVVSGTAPQEMTFHFTVSEGSADEAKHVKAGTLGPQFTQPTVTFTKTGEDQFGVGTYDQTFSFDLVKLLGDNYNKVGKYAYTITENDDKIPGITKDPKTINMVVSVVNQQKENLTDSTGYGYYVALRDNDSSEKTDGKFTNTYNAYSLDVKKTVQGDFGDLNEEFNFNITLGAADGKDNNYATVTITSDNAANNGKTLTVGSNTTITLKHNEKATFSNLPEGVTYTVTENGSAWSTTESGKAMKDQYTVTLENGTLTGKDAPEATGTISTANASVGFINTHVGTPDMGVVLDNAPYIALLAIVAIGGVALVLNKRRRDEE